MTEVYIEREQLIMMGKTHKIGGALVGVIASDVFLQPDMKVTAISTITIVTSSIIGSLLPDIDKKESTIGRKLWFISWPIYFIRIMIKFLSYLSPALCLPLYKRIYKTMGHRYLAHSLFTWATISGYLFFLQHTFKRILVKYISSYFNLDSFSIEIINKLFVAFVLGISIGMLSHILLDMYTRDGVAIWMPLSDKKIRFPFAMKTNGLREQVLRVILTLGIVAAVYYIYSPYIKSSITNIIERWYIG